MSTHAATPLMRAFTRELARAGGLLSPDYLASGMTVGEARCLYEVGHAEGLEISALADRLDLDLGHVSRIVSRLVERKLVTKRAPRRDARARSVSVTSKGTRTLAALDEHANQRLDRWLASKPGVAVDQLLSGLRAFVSADTPAREVEIRAPRPGELGHVIARHGAIYARDFAYPAVFEHYVIQAFADFLADFAPPGDRFWIAELGGQFAGSIASKALPDATAQLRFLLVEPEARGRGIATQLVGRVLDHARARGDRKIVLDTASDLTAARAIYAAHGFRCVESTPGAPWLPTTVHSERWELVLAAP